MIKAIETRYNGYRFRSRLEARWAVFFDAMGIEYKYEFEGYQLPLDNGWYLPDFWLPGLNVFVEIKGPQPTEDELVKAHSLAHSTGKSVVVISNDCWYTAPIHLFHFNGDPSTGEGDFFMAVGGRWHICTSCGSSAITNTVKRKRYIYCFNPKCKYALSKGSIKTGVKRFEEKEFPEIDDGFLAITPQSLEFLKHRKALVEAYSAARSARFEHGETPKVLRGKPKK